MKRRASTTSTILSLLLGLGLFGLRPPVSTIHNPQFAITEWYHNTAAGLDQGFTIESAPGERREGE